VRPRRFPQAPPAMVRLAYGALGLICYAILSSVWLEHDLFEAASLVHLHKRLEKQGGIEKESLMIAANSNNKALTATVRKTESKDKKNIVAFVVTITSCSGHKGVPFEIVEGAAVLRYSISQNLLRHDFEMYAFYHPDAGDCASTLQELGYTVQARDTPVAVEDIQGDALRERIVKNGYVRA